MCACVCVVRPDASLLVETDVCSAGPAGQDCAPGLEELRAEGSGLSGALALHDKLTAGRV